MSENYYEILGISKDASDDDIKRAYKKLALKTHPDKNGGDDSLFKKINLAYETLSDQDKRREYDNPHVHTSHFDIFENMFKGMNININVNGRSQNQGVTKRKNHVYKLNINLRDVHHGLMKTLKLKLNSVCFNCKRVCNQCNGLGRISRVQQTGPFIQQIQMSCSICDGRGNIHVKEMTSCQSCNGIGEIMREEMIKVEIPVGVHSGYGIVYHKLGEQPQNTNEEAGDLIVEIVVDEHPYFKRENDDLIYKVRLTLCEVFLGKKLNIGHFDEDMKINTNMFGIIDPNKRYHIRGRGLCGKGDLIFVFEVIYPEKVLDNYERESLKNVFKNIGLI